MSERYNFSAFYIHHSRPPPSSPMSDNMNPGKKSQRCRNKRSLGWDTGAVSAPPDKHIGKFKLARVPLGVGGYATVYRAVNIDTNEPVAVKLFYTSVGPDRNVMSMAAIMNEVAAMSHVCTEKHPNIINFFGWWHSGTECALVLELCNGDNLFKLLLREGALSEERVRPLFRGILAGLRYLHAKGVVHRDLKLENIVLGGSEGTAPMIVDFGLAHVYRPDMPEEKLTKCCGSRSYCAPEVIDPRTQTTSCKGYDGYAADCWSLGVCLFCLLASFFPVVEASSHDQRFVEIKSAQPTKSTCHTIFDFYNRPCQLSAPLVGLLDGLLRVRAECRHGLTAVAASSWLLPEENDEIRVGAPPAPQRASSI